VGGTTPAVQPRHKGDLLYLTFAEKLKPGRTYRVEVEYGGKPASILGMGPVFWGTDANKNPRVSTLTQGIGPHFVMPCKDLLYDEPDSCLIRVTAPTNLVAVANGKLTKKESKVDKTTWHYAVINPINVYNISFNIGDFTTLAYPYTDVNGVEHNIEAAVLKSDTARMRPFYAQTPAVMGVLEEIYGVFPWWSDGCRFVQSYIRGGAMEHQSAISMGDIDYFDIRKEGMPSYNSTLIHELVHEWWGNSITASDYGDAWLHEGMATYGEALAIEKFYGADAYFSYARRAYMYGDLNERPVIKPFGVRYNSWANSRDYNIYAKGGLFLHTLRMQVGNDSLFFAALKGFHDAYAKQNITTAQLESHFNQWTGRNLSPLFHAYLRQVEPPVLQIYYDAKTGLLYHRFKAGVPPGFSMRIDVKAGEERISFMASEAWCTQAINPNADRSIDRERSGYYDIKVMDVKPELVP
jgi:aminopeptidase N